MKKNPILLTLAFMLITSIGFSQDIKGSWTLDWDDGQGNSGTATLKIADATYEVDLDSDGNTDIKGKYTISDGVMTINDTEGDNMCANEGKFKAAVDGDTFTMTQITDDCNRGGPEGAMKFKRKA